MISYVIVISLCVAVLFLTGNGQHRVYGAASGLVCAGAWIVAGIVAGTFFVVLVALFCLICFARLLVPGLLKFAVVRRSHAR